MGATWRKVTLFDDPSRPEADEMVRRVRLAIRPETRALGVTWVHSSTGVRMPIRPIADAIAELNEFRRPSERVMLVVDGTHGFGSTASRVIDLGADFFIASTHKWMFAPRGTGIIHGRTDAWPRIQPTIATYLSWDLFRAWATGRRPGPTRADYVSPGGFIAYEYQWAMKEAFAFHLGIGRRPIARRITALNGRLKRGLAGVPGITLHTPMDDAWSAGIVSFDLDGVAPDLVVSDLLERRVIASTSPYRKPSVRLSAGIMNTEQEVDRALEAVAEVACRRGLRRAC